MRLPRRLALGVVSALVVLAASSCGTRSATPRSDVPPPPPPIRVGTLDDSPPYAFRRDGQLVGLEVDFANRLFQSTGRPVTLIPMAWDDLLNAVASGKIDVAMAGITITPEREVRFSFSDAYFRANTAALIRRADRGKFRDPRAVCTSPIDVGVLMGSIPEKELRDRCPSVIPRLYPKAVNAVLELQQRRVDAVVHDAPVLRWLSSNSEAELEVVDTQLGVQSLAWAFAPNDSELRNAANAALARMRDDGTLAKILVRWIPAADRATRQR